MSAFIGAARPFKSNRDTAATPASDTSLAKFKQVLAYYAQAGP